MVRRKVIGTLAVILGLALSRPGHAQEVVLADGAGGPILLMPEPRFGGRLFANEGVSPEGRLLAGGTVGGHPINQTRLGTLHVGFDYLRPLWTFRDFTLAVPVNRAGDFPLLGDTGHVDNHFAFAPRVKYNYDISSALSDLEDDVDFPISDVGASGTFLNLSGRLRRQVTSAGGAFGELNANSSLTIVTANLVEAGKRLRYARLVETKEREPWEPLRDLEIELRIGTRYSSIDQNYTGSLTSGTGAANVSTRYSSQSFRGIGLTTALNFLLPRGNDWLLFFNTRASILVGDNRKDSTLTVNVIGQPAVSETIGESSSVYLPIVELELGFEWGREMALRFAGRDAVTLFSVRAALVSQFWGDVGPLSAGSTQAFRTSDLFLVGGHIMVGFHR